MGDKVSKSTAQSMIQLVENDIKIYRSLISKCCDVKDAHLIESYNEKIVSIEKTIEQLRNKIKIEDTQKGCY